MASLMSSMSQRSTSSNRLSWKIELMMDSGKFCENRISNDNAFLPLCQSTYEALLTLVETEVDAALCGAELVASSLVSDVSDAVALVDAAPLAVPLGLALKELAVDDGPLLCRPSVVGLAVVGDASAVVDTLASVGLADEPDGASVATVDDTEVDGSAVVATELAAAGVEDAAWSTAEVAGVSAVDCWLDVAAAGVSVVGWT